jgi:hypothetical protein
MPRTLGASRRSGADLAASAGQLRPKLDLLAFEQFAAYIRCASGDHGFLRELTRGDATDTAAQALLVPTMIAGAALVRVRYRRGTSAAWWTTCTATRHPMPPSTTYDTVTAPLLGRFFTRVAGDLAELAPRARLLEVGSGPGRLAARWPRTPPLSGSRAWISHPRWSSGPPRWRSGPAWPTGWRSGSATSPRCR